MQASLCKKLEEIKKLNPANYHKINRVLRFLYKTVGEEYFDKKINSAQLSEEIYHAAHIGGSTMHQLQVSSNRNLKEDLFSRYIEEKGSIIDLLFDICKDENPSFAKYFFDKIEVPLSTFENGIFYDTDSYLYVYNLYTMLKAYENNKEDFDSFKIIVDDICYIFISNAIANEIETSDKKVLINKILSNEFYPSNDLLRGLMIRTIKEARTRKDEADQKRLDNMFMFLNELIRDKIRFSKLGYVGYTIKPQIFDIIANDITLLVHRDLLPGCEPFYDPILLFGNHYQALKEEIKVVGVNHREEVYSYFIDLNPGMFEELNKDQEEDSFNECIKNIFDSDTYYELYRKLESLSKADESYKKGDKESAFFRIKDLASNQYKEALLGSVLIFPTDNNNKIEKPKSIGERTKTLFLKHDLIPQDFNWDILESSAYSLQTLHERLETEAFEYNASKQISLQEQAQPKPEEPKQKKKSRFSLFG